MDYIELGASPSDESCVRVSKTEDYMPAMREELKRYKAYLESLFPIPEDVNCYFKIKWFPHDFGSYGEVCIVFDPEDEQSSEFAYNVEESTPALWGQEPATAQPVKGPSKDFQRLIDLMEEVLESE